jgi:4'-phosphopantetheinyl transferase
MGVVFIKKVSGTAQLGLWHIHETTDVLRLPLSLTTEEEKVFHRKISDRKKKEWLASRNLLQAMIPENFGLYYDAHGKPFLKESHTHISISHSGAYAVVYTDSSKSVGTDIQKLKPDISKGVEYFLNKAELNCFDIADNIMLHILWSAKESVFKYIGSHELNLKEDVILMPFDRNQSGTIQVNILHYSHKQGIRVAYKQLGDYILTRTF